MTGCEVWLESREPLRGGAVFAADFVGFLGHFEGGAILPGFLHVELGVEVLRLAGMGGELLEVREGKFLGAILPGARVRVEVEKLEEVGWFSVGIFLLDGEMVSRFLVLVKE